MRLLLQQPLEILEHACDQRLPARVLGGRRLGEQPQQITRLLDRLRPGLGGRREEVLFELLPARSERRLVALDLDAPAPDLGRLLGRQAAMPVEIGRTVHHRARPLQPAIMSRSRSRAPPRSCTSLRLRTEECNSPSLKGRTRTTS